MTSANYAVVALVIHVSLLAVFITRALLRPNREPSSRVAWVLVILAVPALGILAYILLGETNVGRRKVARYREISARLFEKARTLNDAAFYEKVDPEHRHLFRLGQSISHFRPRGGNTAHLMEDSAATVDAMVADIDAARDHVHILFYIWLTDNNGLKVVEAAKRAALRGVTVRAMADDLGSRGLIRSMHWTDMADAGVRLARALPIGNPFLRPIKGRIDLRNHRKILVIDNRVTYCGSQNCADPEFLVKAKYAPWVDLMVRFEGPVAMQNQALFLQDWMTHVPEDLTGILRDPGDGADGVVAQVIGTGPTVRPSAMPEMFEALMHAARDELVITTPYYVPSESMQSAIRAAGQRGVDTVLVLPARNDSWIVSAASRSYYADLLQAGVRVFEYQKGLLHAKTLTIDGKVALIGSANLDRRSFDLNYENNILLECRDLTAAIRTRQQDYLADSRELHADEVRGWSAPRRLWNNTIGMMGPVL
ncbi:cardiolipin synthase [Palleronia sp. KMU-117]|uniref:cardiolipin synthase n=1 Tax=Palleronia sp. KMU-117 TaxID=3434108 RepID=UPI003D709F4D